MNAHTYMSPRAEEDPDASAAMRMSPTPMHANGSAVPNWYPVDAAARAVPPKIDDQHRRHRSSSKRDSGDRERRRHRRRHSRNHNHNHNHNHSHSHSHSHSRTKRRRSSKHRRHQKRHHGHHSKKDTNTKIKDLYRKGFIPTPTFLPQFSPYYIRLDANIELTAMRGSGKTTLVKELLAKRAKEFALIVVFSETEKVNGAMSKHNPAAFTYSRMAIDVLKNILTLRERQSEQLLYLKEAMERTRQTKTREYEKLLEKEHRLKNQYILFFFDDMTASRSNLNNDTFSKLRNMGRHYNVCMITNKQSDVNTQRSQRNQVDTSIIFKTDDKNQRERTWQTQFRDSHIFPTFDDFEQAHKLYCEETEKGALIHVNRFDDRVPKYISQRYHTFAYQAKGMSDDEIGTFASRRVQLFSDAVYVPHKLINQYTQEREFAQQMQYQLEQMGETSIPRTPGELGMLPPSSSANPTTQKEGKGKKGAASKKPNAMVTEREDPNPVPVGPGKVRIQTDPTGSQFWASTASKRKFQTTPSKRNQKGRR